MKLEDKIWLATVIDTEGTLGLGLSKRKAKLKNGSINIYTTYSALLMVTNTYLPLLERCKALLESGELIQKRKNSHLGKKNCFQLFLRNREQLENILRQIEPYLMEKRELAVRLINWLEWFKKNRVSEIGKRLSPQQKREARTEYDSRALYVREVMTTFKNQQVTT